MQWFKVFFWTVLLCFCVISYSAASKINPTNWSEYEGFDGSIFQLDSKKIEQWIEKFEASGEKKNDDGSKWLEKLEKEGVVPINGSTGAGSVSHNPIPPAVWLLSSGIIGIVALRRKFKN